MESLDCVVIGAGVVGLATARALALAGREVTVLEKESAIGTATSARNSGVIHAGLYFSSDWLKTRLCVAGRRALYAYCESHGVPHRRCGKLIVATRTEDIAQLERLLAQGHANGIDDLHLLSREEALRMEPALSCVAALHSPSTGIIDAHALMLAYQGDAEARGAMLALESPVLSGEVTADGIRLDVGGAEPMQVLARTVVNCGGLHAPGFARRLHGMPADKVPQDHLCKGSYFTLSGRSPFSRLVYPPPERAGLGVHLTLDLGGQARFGPDVEWVEAIDYRVDPALGERFYPAIRSYWPGLPEGALQPGYAGIRPKISAPGEAGRDFLIQGPRDHGIAGLVNLFGIESPGLTSSLAIADWVAAMVAE